MDSLKDFGNFLNAQNAVKAIQMGQIAGLIGDTSNDHGLSANKILGEGGFLSPLQKRIEAKTGITVPMVLTALAVYNSGKLGGLASEGIRVFRRFGTSSIQIDLRHSLAKAVDKWLISNSTGKQTPQHVVVEAEGGSSGEQNDSVSSKLTVSQQSGAQWFWYNGRVFLYEYGYQNGESDRAYGDYETLTLVCLGRSPAPLTKFLTFCQSEASSKVKTTEVFTYSKGYIHGSKQPEKPSRPMETIDLDPFLYLDILTDAESYFDEETRAWYHENGTPYRRGYLLYGPPGTGKTSLSFALAGRFDIGLYVINLNEAELDDAKLIERFSNLPDKCVVLLEDIDVAGIVMDRHMAHEPSTDGSSGSDQTTLWEDTSGHQVENRPQPPVASRNSNPQKISAVSLSGLLNAIDGPTSKEGRLLIMTTNAPRSLDPALYRAGRIDKKIYLGYSTKRTGAITFRRIFANDPCNKYSMDEITDFARRFGAKVPLDTFTPAELQNFCMGYRGKPQKAISEFDVFISRRFSGEDGFEYDIGDGGGTDGDNELELSEDEALEDLLDLDFSYLTQEGMSKFRVKNGEDVPLGDGFSQSSDEHGEEAHEAEERFGDHTIRTVFSGPALLALASIDEQSKGGVLDSLLAHFDYDPEEVYGLEEESCSEADSISNEGEHRGARSYFAYFRNSLVPGLCRRSSTTPSPSIELPAGSRGPRTRGELERLIAPLTTSNGDLRTVDPMPIVE